MYAECIEMYIYSIYNTIQYKHTYKHTLQIHMSTSVVHYMG